MDQLKRFVCEQRLKAALNIMFQLMGTAGLGLKRKTEHQQQQRQEKVRDPLGLSLSGKMMKAKTLSEKRQNLQAEILRYGVAAIEKMYPRQSTKKVTWPQPIVDPNSVGLPCGALEQKEMVNCS